MEKSLILDARKEYHKLLVANKVLTLSKDNIASNADSGNMPSIAIAKLIATELNANVGIKLKGQTAGNLFEQLTMHFIKNTFPRLQHLRPGNWEILNLGNQSNIKTYDFAQYEHLAYLSEIVSQNKLLATTLGNDYMIAPDIVICRKLYDDTEINANSKFIDDSVCCQLCERKPETNRFSMRQFRQNGQCEVIEPKIVVQKHLI